MIRGNDMDKREYQEKLDEINRLIAAEDYPQAARVADSIDWKRVRNVQTLVMVSEIYEAVERYEDSKVLLLRAYRRSPLGRTVLYRLVECTIRLGQFDEAIEYYSEYVQAAPHDNNKYILKYKIYRGRGSSLDEQIDILKEYLDQEYNEKWVYELAKLQVQADRVQEGLSTCDDLVLWFHSGKYVIKALELKKKYAPLTPKQQEIYDNRFNQEEEDDEEIGASYLKQAQMQAMAERAAAQQEAIKSELAADISHAAKLEAAKEEISQKAQAAQEAVDETAAQAEKALADKAEEIAAKAGLTVETPQGEAVPQAEAAAEEASAGKAAVAASQDEETAQAETGQAEAALQGEETAQAEAAPEAVASQKAAPEAADEITAQAESALQGETPEYTAGMQDVSLQEEGAAAAGAGADVTAAGLQPEEAGSTAAGVPEETAGDGPQDEAPVQAAEALTEEVLPAEEIPEEEPVSEEKLQEDMVRSMREIVSGVGPKEGPGEEEAALDEVIEQSKQDQEEAVAARGADMTFQVPRSEASQKRTAGKLTIDDILLSMGDRGEHVREVTGGSVLSASEEAELTAQAAGMAGSGLQQEQSSAEGGMPEQVSAAEGEAPERASAAESEAPEQSPAAGSEVPEQVSAAESEAPAQAEGTAGAASPLSGQDPEVPKFLRDEVKEARRTEELPVSDIASAADAMEAEAREAEAREAETRETEAAGDLLASLPKVPHVAYTKEIAEAKTKKLPVEEISRLHEAFLSESLPGTSEDAAILAASKAAGAAEKAAEMAEAEVGDMQPEYAGEEPAEQAGEARSAEAEDVQGAGGGMSASARESEAAAQEAGQAAEAAGEEAPVQAAEGVQETREVPKSAEEPKVYDGRAHLKDYQLDLFRGFIGIGSLEEQIANAIRQAEGKQGDRTSRTGNILILGAHGCGKTTIATGIAKAIAEDTGTHSIKMARIYAADLNRKDIAATIAKIAGGVLIVEEAGDLDDAIVDQLTTAMEFRTDGLIMILEDEQRYIHDLLMRHPRFTMKFTAQIYIPEYTNEELVNFGRIYAESKDYVFSDRALEALCDRVEAAAQNGDAVSVTNIIELVDRGIRNANKFFRRIGSAKKRYDEMDRVILKEKDFR